MTLDTFPRRWAGNTTFSGGAHAGDPTRVDPGAAVAGNGFYPDLGFAAEHANHQLGSMSDAERRLLLLATLQLRRVTLEGTAITDTAESMGAVQRRQDTPLLAVKTAQALIVSDIGMFFEQGVPASITSLVTDAAFLSSGADSGRILVIGTGGNRCSYSDDDGANWSAGTDLGGVAERVLVTSSGSTFYVGTTSSGGNHRIQSGGAATGWSQHATVVPDARAFRGMGAFGNNASVVLCFDDAGGKPDFHIFSGANFADSGGTVPNSASFDEGGCIAGIGNGKVYHAGRKSSGASIQVSSSPDGINWTELATLTPPASAAFNACPRLLMCPNTGLLVVVCSTAGGQTVAYASLDGTDWVGPSCIFPAIGVDGFAIAGGRLLATFDDMVFASDGIGF